MIRARTLMVALALGASAVALPAGCSSDAGPAERLVRLSPAALDKVHSEAKALSSVASVVRNRGVEGYAGPPQIERFIEECDELQPVLGKSAEGGELSGTYGVVFHGRREAPRYATPNPKEFNFTEGDPHYLDPNKIHESAGTTIGMQLFETLYVPAPGNAPPLPGAAESHTVSEDGKTYTFKLRKGLVWSDGTPLTARDFEYSWFRALDPKTESQTVFLHWLFIKGAKAFYEAEVKDRSTVGIRALDDHTLQVELTAPAPFFVDVVTYVAFAPVPKHVIDKHDKHWIEPKNIVVSGAYTMTVWQERDRIVLEKNPSYWDAANVQIEKSTIYMSNNESKNMVLYKTGKVDAARQIGNDKIKKFIEEGREDLWIAEIMCTYYYVIRAPKPPFDSQLLRRAVNMSIDKERMTKHILAAFQQPATSIVPPMFEATLGYVSPYGDEFNPTKARQLLAQAGFPRGYGLGEIEIVYNTYEGHRLIAEFVQRNLQENLGVKVIVNNMEWKSLLDKVKLGDFQIARTSWCADYPDPTTFLEVLRGDGPSNYAKYQNPHDDALLDRVQMEPDARRRNVLMCAAEKALTRDVPLMPFYYYTRGYLLAPYVKGYEPQFLDHHLLKYISIEAD